MNTHRRSANGNKPTMPGMRVVLLITSQSLTDRLSVLSLDSSLNTWNSIQQIAVLCINAEIQQEPPFDQLEEIRNGEERFFLIPRKRSSRFLARLGVSSRILTVFVLGNHLHVIDETRLTVICFVRFFSRVNKHHRTRESNRLVSLKMNQTVDLPRSQRDSDSEDEDEEQPTVVVEEPHIDPVSEDHH